MIFDEDRMDTVTPEFRATGDFNPLALYWVRLGFTLSMSAPTSQRTDVFTFKVLSYCNTVRQ
jgi:hypothetical protein